jgi:hypothetical protein
VSADDAYEDIPMKILVLATALVAAAAVAVPTEASTGTKKKKKASNVQAPATYSHRERVPASRQHPYGVYSADGELLGMDPDPNVRLMIRRDPKPWENDS